MAQQQVSLTRLGQRTAGAIINANFAELYGGQLLSVDVKTANYTLVAGDNGHLIRMNLSSAGTITLPNNLPLGTQILVIQTGAGQVTFNPAVGTTLYNRQNFTKTAGQHAVCSLIVTSNTSGTSAIYNLSGDGVA